MQTLADRAPVGQCMPTKEKGGDCSPPFPVFETDRKDQKPTISEALIARGEPKFTKAEDELASVSRPPLNEPT